jgi:hypothetical protein
VAIGASSLATSTAGASNVAVGAGSLYTSTGDYNTGVGKSALYANTTGASNTAVGYGAGVSVTTGDNNLFLGRDAGLTGSPGGNITTADNIIVLGDENITAANIQVDWTIASDARDKTDVEDLSIGLDFVKQLKPKTYRWDKRSRYSEDQSIDPDGSHKAEQLDVGFLAQDVDALEKSLDFKDTDKKNLISSVSDDGQMYGLKYTKFVPMLVNAIQELSAEVEELKSKLKE